MGSKHSPYLRRKLAAIGWIVTCIGLSIYLVVSDIVVQHYWDVQINQIPLFFSPGKPLSPQDVTFFFSLTMILAWCAALLEVLKSPRPLVLRLVAAVGLSVIFLIVARFPQILGLSVTWSTRVSSWGLHQIVPQIEWNTLTRAILFVGSSSLFALLAALLHSSCSRIAARSDPPTAPASDRDSRSRGEQ